MFWLKSDSDQICNMRSAGSCCPSMIGCYIADIFLHCLKKLTHREIQFIYNKKKLMYSAVICLMLSPIYP